MRKYRFSSLKQRQARFAPSIVGTLNFRRLKKNCSTWLRKNQVSASVQKCCPMKAIPLAGCIFFIVAGCNSTAVAPTPNVNAPVPTVPKANGSGLLLKDARQKYIKLLPNMTQEEVRALLGEPDEAASGTFGSATANPWIGLMWIYEWRESQAPPGYHRMIGSPWAARLRILFERSKDGWVVNGWNWLP